MKKKMSFYLRFGLILTGVASVCIITGLLIFSISLKNFDDSKKNWIKTNGVLRIEESGGNKKVSVRFTTSEGSNITVDLNTYDFTMSNDKRVSIYYDPENPRNVRLGSTVLFSFFFLLIFGGFGTVFLIPGIKYLKKDRNLKTKKKKLLASGHFVIADIINVNQDTNVSYNSEHPYIIQSRYSENGTDYLFESHDIWFDESYIIIKKALEASPMDEPQKVKVYVDKNDFNIYYVDEESLK
ncbi:MAG: DUF3592 domain-containing protein [Treponema sp.]|nr:DUF3592 domain-containing protein [Treponema sp.]